MLISKTCWLFNGGKEDQEHENHIKVEKSLMFWEQENLPAYLELKPMHIL
jgi:hypothetical protein